MGLMVVTYKNKKLERVCTDAYYATRQYGKKMAEKIQTRIDQISAFPNVEQMLQFQIGRCHALANNRKGQYAVDLIHPYRLVFTIDKFGNLQVANIQEIVDYH